MASRQHFALAAKIIGTRPNARTKRFTEEVQARREIGVEPHAAPTSAAYRMIGAYVPYQKGGMSGSKQAAMDYSGAKREVNSQ